MRTDSVLAQDGAELGFTASELEQITAEIEQFQFTVPPFDESLLKNLCTFPELDAPLFPDVDLTQLFGGTEQLLKSLGLPPASDPRCQAKNRRGERCQMNAIYGKRVCKFHGGLSTGARTQAGRDAIRESNRRRAKPRSENLTKCHPSRAEEAPAEPVPAADGLTDTQRKAVSLLWEGKPIDAEIARACGVSRRTLARWKHLPEFEAAYKRVSDEYSAKLTAEWWAKYNAEQRIPR